MDKAPPTFGYSYPVSQGSVVSIILYFTGLVGGDYDFINGIYTLNDETPVQIVIDLGVSDWRFNVLKGGYISTSNSNASWDTNSLSILDSNDNRVWVSKAYYRHSDGEAEVYEVNDTQVSKGAYINELNKYNIEKENIRLTRSFR